MLVGWTLFLIKSFARRSISAARITTLVVPSPTSESYNYDNSTMILAAGCSTSNYFKIVAPGYLEKILYHHLLLLHHLHHRLTFYLNLVVLKKIWQCLTRLQQPLLNKSNYVPLFDLTSPPCSRSPKTPNSDIMNIDILYLLFNNNNNYLVWWLI